MSEVLVERDGELAALEAALASAGGGRGETLMLEGEAGIGKSSLLAVATERARARGMRVLSARSSALEEGVAYGVARQLLLPALGEDPEQLLTGAAALAERVREMPVALLLAARPAAAWSDPEVAAEVSGAVPALRPARLSSAGVAASLALRLGTEPDPAFVAAAHAARASQRRPRRAAPARRAHAGGRQRPARGTGPRVGLWRRRAHGACTCGVAPGGRAAPPG